MEARAKGGRFILILLNQKVLLRFVSGLASAPRLEIAREANHRVDAGRIDA
jgi:hypothetical protein